MITKEGEKEQNPNSAKILLHQYTTLIVGGFGFEKKTNALLNLINHEPVIDEIYLYSKGHYVAKYQLLSSKKGSQA